MDCLDGRKSPAETIGLYISRCQYVWFVQMRWEKQESQWQLLQCRVAPDFPPSASKRPDGWICNSICIHDLPELRFCPLPLNLHDLLMLSAEDDVTPPGFRLLSRWSDNIAHLHDLPVAPLQLVFDRPSKHEPSSSASRQPSLGEEIGRWSCAWTQPLTQSSRSALRTTLSESWPCMLRQTQTLASSSGT